MIGGVVSIILNVDMSVPFVLFDVSLYYIFQPTIVPSATDAFDQVKLDQVHVLTASFMFIGELYV